MAELKLNLDAVPGGMGCARSLELEPTEDVKAAFRTTAAVIAEELKGRGIDDLAAKSGCSYEESEGGFVAESFGEKVCLRWPDCEISSGPWVWHKLLLLRYFQTADGTKPAGEWKSFEELDRSFTAGRTMKQLINDKLGKALGHLEPAEVRERCARLGGVFVKSSADVCADFSFMPLFPLRMNLWLADDEFPASVQFLVDSTATRHMKPEDIITVGELLMTRLSQQPG